jgi:hypothetical protein
MNDTPVSAGQTETFKFEYAYPYDTDPYVTGAGKLLGKPRYMVTHHDRARFKEVFFDTLKFRLEQPTVENEAFPISAWRCAVQNGDTFHSYRDWSDQQTAMAR